MEYTEPDTEPMVTQKDARKAVYDVLMRYHRGEFDDARSSFPGMSAPLTAAAFAISDAIHQAAMRH